MKTLSIIALLALGGLLAACGSEQQSDPAVLDTPPDLGAALGTAKTQPVDTNDGTVSHLFEFKTTDDGVVLFQIDSSADPNSTTTDWTLDSAEPVFADLTDGKPKEIAVLPLASGHAAPSDVKAWSGKSGSATLYAEAWERNQCVALVVSNLSKAETAAALAKADEYLIRACGE